jgi:hypothetical protein
MKIKLNINTEKTINIVKDNLKYIPVCIISLVVIVFLVLTYFALYPREDAEHIAEGEKRVESLDIRFNMKLLAELSATKTPTQLGTAGGRDPFSGF